MTSKNLKKLVIDTGIILKLDVKQISLLFLVVNLAYNEGWLDAKESIKKTDIEIALENGASLDDLPVK